MTALTEAEQLAIAKALAYRATFDTEATDAERAMLQALADRVGAAVTIRLD